MMPRRPLPPAEAAKTDTPKEETAKADRPRRWNKKIVEQVKADKEQLKSDLTFLTSQIGPRLTGSPQVDRANHWTEEQFRALGLENAHLESWSIANSWTRGPASGRVTSPARQRIDASDGGIGRRARMAR